MEIRVGLRCRHKRLGKVVEIVHYQESVEPRTNTAIYMCLVRADDGHDYHASGADLELVVEQATFSPAEFDDAPHWTEEDD